MRQETPILLVGTGPMACEYARVLKEGLKLRFVVASRDRARALEFAASVGAEDGLALSELGPESLRFELAIVASAAESLVDVTKRLLNAGLTYVLLEKPGALSAGDALELGSLAKQMHARVRIAYNRRYYASVQGLRRILAEEAPACASFDFTEWSSRIADLEKGPGVKESWAISNSSHVIDTVSYLLGKMQALQAVVRGKNELDWHPAGSTFVGMAMCGITPVSWATSWVCPGRWGIEIMTRRGRYRLSPMERLQVMRPNTISWVEVEEDYSLDTQFKPGLYCMVREFRNESLGMTPSTLPDCEENAELLATIATIVGYAE